MTEDYYRIEHQLADGSWVRISAPVYSEDDAKKSLARARAKLPSEGFRLIKRTITNEVVDA